MNRGKFLLGVLWLYCGCTLIPNGVLGRCNGIQRVRQTGWPRLKKHFHGGVRTGDAEGSVQELTKLVSLNSRFFRSCAATHGFNNHLATTDFGRN